MRNRFLRNELIAGCVLRILALAILHPLIANAQAIVTQEDERTLAQGSVEFHPGVFRLEPDGERITPLCLQVGPRWQRVGTDRECPNPPPPDQRPEISRFAIDKTFLGIRNLGIDTRQWRAVQPGSSPSAGSMQRRIGGALSYEIGDSDVRWRFHSATLPREVRVPIPGAAVAVHFGRNYADDVGPTLFEPGSHLLVEASIAVPKAKLTGQTHTGVSMAIGLYLPTVSGKHRGLTMIVSVFHPDPKGPAETLRSDQRVNFGSARLGAGNRYVIAQANRQKTAPWTTPERFAFRFSHESLRNLVMDANSRSDPGGATKEAFDMARLGEARVAGVTVRNEYSSLHLGNADAEVVVDYLRLVRVPAR